MTAPFSPENPFAPQGFSPDNPFVPQFSPDNPFVPRDDSGNPLREFAEGLALSLNRTGTGFIGLAGRIPGLGGLREFAEENRRQAEQIFTPEGIAGTAGSITGTILGEGATTLAGGGVALKGLQLAGRGSRTAARAAQGLERLRQAGLGEEGLSRGARAANLARRTAANVAPVVPVDVAIGASRAEEGQSPLVEGAKEVAFDIAGSGVFEAARGALAARRAARAVPEPVASATPGDPNIRTLPKQPIRQRLADVIDPERATRLERLTVERRAAERLAETDVLTGFGNRRAFEKAIKTADADPALEVISFDANNFGKVNKLDPEISKLGFTSAHDAGDQQLRDMAGAIRRAMTNAGVPQRAFRQSGDEFVSIVPKGTGEAIAADVDRLFGTRPFKASGPVAQDFEVSLTGSVGDTFSAADRGLQVRKGLRKRGQPLPQQVADIIEPVTSTSLALGSPAEGLGGVQPGQAFARDNPALAEKVINEAQVIVDEGPVRRFITDVEQAEAARGIGFREIKAAEFSSTTDFRTFHAMGNVWGRNTDQLTEAYKRLQDINAGRVNIPPASVKNELTILEQTIDALEAENKDLLKTYIGQSSEAGRNLRSLQAMSNRNLDPLAWTARAQRAADRPLSIEEIHQINLFAETQNRDGLVRFVRELAPPVRFFGKGAAKGAFFNAVRRAGFLTGGRTQAKNFLSNTGEATLQSADQPVQAFVDMLIGSYTGQRSVGLVNPVRRLIAGGRGLLRGIGTARKVALGRVDISPGTARKIEQPFQRLEIADPEAVSPVLKNTVMRANRVVDGYVKFMGRFQDAADRPFRQAAFEQSILDQATASTLHLKGKARKEAIREFTERALANPTDDMALFASSVAEEAVFQNRSVAGKFVSGAKGNLERIGLDPTQATAIRQGARASKFVADYFIPFSNTPGAVVGRIVERSPLGFANTLTGGNQLRKLRNMARDVTGGELDIQHLINLQRDVSKSTARALTGTLAILTGAELARRGHMSGRFPEDSGRRDLMLQNNVVEDAILIDGRWRKLTGISPLGNLVALGAQMALDFNDPSYTTSETLSQAGFGISRTVMDQSFLRGTKELLDAVTGGQAAARFPQQAAGSVVPVIVRDVTNVIDPRIRAPENFKQAIQSNLPGYSFQVPVALDRLGKPRRRDPEGRATGLIDPFSSRTAVSGDETTRELNRIGARIPRLSRRRKGARVGRTVTTEDETEEEFRQRNQTTGQETIKALQITFSHPAYRRLTEEQQQDAALAVIQGVRRTITTRGRPVSWRALASRQIANARRP